MTPDLPPPKPVAAVKVVEEEDLSPEAVKAKLKLTQSACIQHGAAAENLREKSAASPATKGFRLPKKK